MILPCPGRTKAETDREQRTYSAVSSLETLQLGQSLLLEDLLRHGTSSNKALESLDGDIPKVIVLLTEQNNQTSGLGVERAGHVQDSRIDELLDLRVRDGAVLAKLVDGPAGLGRLDEGVGGGGHVRCWGGGGEGIGEG